MAEEVTTYAADGFFAATPPMHMLLLRLAADDEPRQATLVDISRTYFIASIEMEVFVDLLPGSCRTVAQVHVPHSRRCSQVGEHIRRNAPVSWSQEGPCQPMCAPPPCEVHLPRGPRGRILGHNPPEGLGVKAPNSNL